MAATGFQDDIRRWVAVDSQLKTLGEQTKLLRRERDEAETKIMDYVEANNLANATVNISDGKLRFVNTRQMPALTLQYVEECLGKVLRPEQVHAAMTAIKTNRQAKIVPDIKRYYAKK
jgi:hypothetical protein